MFNLLFGLGPQEILIVAVMILVLFGGRKIPELMKGLGKGMKEFKDAKDGNSEGSTTPSKTEE